MLETKWISHLQFQLQLGLKVVVHKKDLTWLLFVKEFVINRLVWILIPKTIQNFIPNSCRKSILALNSKRFCIVTIHQDPKSGFIIFRNENFPLKGEKRTDSVYVIWEEKITLNLFNSYRGQMFFPQRNQKCNCS